MSREATPRLGRGLAALLGEAPQPSSPIRTLPVDVLQPGPFQPRASMAPEPLAELVESVRRQGILQPILVRPAPGAGRRFEIVAGERRWRAAQSAGLHEVPVLVRELSDSDAMAAALVENLQRQDLNAIEEAEGYRRLGTEFGLTQEQLGQAVGKSRSHVANSLRLLQLPQAVRVELQSGALTAGHARALLSHPDPARAALQVIARGLSVRQTELMVQPRGPGAARGERPARDPEIKALEGDLSAALGLRVGVSFDGRGGSVRIDYRNLDQLDALVLRLKGG